MRNSIRAGGDLEEHTPVALRTTEISQKFPTQICGKVEVATRTYLVRPVQDSKMELGGARRQRGENLRGARMDGTNIL